MVIILALVAVVIAAPVIAIVIASGLRARVDKLERQVRVLHDRLQVLERGAPPEPRVEPVTYSHTPAPALEPVPEPIATTPEPIPPRAATLPRFSLEDVVGGRLPIWIGGVALVLAGFFLVRYSIESGLLGPLARTLLAAIFSALLIAASEAARRLPATASDPRVAQVLAGAGVASAYGTLYIAAAQYHLVGPATGFAIMAAITAAALFLALRHGPPTAVMALIGGFVAPLVAGFDAAGVGPLLVYLALFVSALFGLAIRRGWAWLAIAAVVAAFAWANLIVVILGGEQAGLVAAFVVALAIAASLALPSAGTANRWLRLAPLVAGFLQLAVIAPVLSFDTTFWTFYLVLSAATLVLAWRDNRFTLAALGAAIVVTLLIGLSAATAGYATLIAAPAAALLFGGAGLAFSRRSPGWAATAAIGLSGPILAWHAAAPGRFPALAWSTLELALAAAAGALAWRHRDRADTRDTGLIGGTMAAALLASVALAEALPLGWSSIPLAAAMAALAWWARDRDDRDLALLPGLALLGCVLLPQAGWTGFTEALIASLTGERGFYAMLPGPVVIILRFAIPAAAGIATLVAVRDSFGRARQAAGLLVTILATFALYGLAKQPLHINNGDAFLAYGFPERGVITLAFLAAGWLAWRRNLPVLGNALAGVALARIAYFDLLILNPAVVPQHVGVAALLPALAALLLVQRMGVWRLAALALTALAVAALVRQLAHGSVLTGDLGSTENWGYSAAFLLLAIAWLWRGISTGSRTLRSAGLGLLTVVTLKVFLIDVASSAGILRILALLGLGVALIGIGWAYRRVFPGGEASVTPPQSPPA